MAVSIISSFHLVKNKQWSQKTLSIKCALAWICKKSALDFPSTHSITEPFFIELLCFLDRTQEKDIIIVGLNKATVVWVTDSNTLASERYLFFRMAWSSLGKNLASHLLPRSQKAIPVCSVTSCFLIKFSYTLNDGNIFKGIILGRFPVIQHFQTYPNGFWNIFCLWRAAFRMR